MPLVPEFVEDTVQQVFGERGRSWLNDLPELIQERCTEWRVEVTGEAFSGGTHSYVAPVRRADGSPAALKITVPDEENQAEATGLHFYDGQGAVRLYEFDPVSKAMLIELAEPGQPLVSQDLDEAHLEGRPEHRDNVAAGCALYRRLWRVPGPVPDGLPDFPKVRDVVERWLKWFPEAGALQARRHPELRELYETAVARAHGFLTPLGPEGIVNHDTHLGNIVSAQREPWLLIDPKPYLGERAFDAGFLIGIQVESNPVAAHAAEVVRRTSELLGVDADRARGWAFLRAVENAIWLAEDDDAPTMRRYRDVAVALA